MAMLTIRWRSVIDVIAADQSLQELILSGGDPLTLSGARLAELSARLQPIPHLKRLRIHTRQPIGLPARVDPGFIAWLGSLPWQTIMVLHCNHPNEIDAEVAGAGARLRAACSTATYCPTTCTCSIRCAARPISRSARSWRAD